LTIDFVAGVLPRCAPSDAAAAVPASSTWTTFKLSLVEVFSFIIAITICVLYIQVPFFVIIIFFK
jgi:hypothetical protein